MSNNTPPNSGEGLELPCQVSLRGKISRVAKLRYTPAGVPIGELTVGVKQRHLEKESVGYFEVVLTGPQAENWIPKLKIGMVLEVAGELWNRNFTNRQGNKVNETKIIAKEINIGGYLGRENKKI